MEEKGREMDRRERGEGRKGKEKGREKKRERKRNEG